MACFKYDDHITGDQLRILAIEPSNDENSMVECTLSTVSRLDRHSYEALSYCWGAATPSCTILVNGSTFEVRENLDHALRHLRAPDRVRYLWVDAICINQEGDRDGKREKSAQVARMGETYSRCTRALAWLGSTGDESTLAMEVIKVRASYFAGQSLSDVRASRVPLPAMIDGVGPATYLTAVMDLLRRPWFTRLWVVQEVCLAPQVIMICGHDVITSVQFANFQLSLRNCPDVIQGMSVGQAEQKSRWVSLLKLLDDGLVYIRQVLQVTQEELPENKSINEIRRNLCGMLRLLWVTRHRQCQNSRDRIYALRAITYDIDHDLLIPNYDDDVGFTYTKAVVAMIECSRKLDVMSLCKGPEASDMKHIHLPSWVPNFNLQLVNTDYHVAPGSLTNFIGSEPYFNATRDSFAQPKYSSNYSELITTGYDIGIVNASSGVSWADGSIQEARRIVAAIPPQAGDWSPTEIFWRTLITDRAHSSSPADAEVEGVEFGRWWDVYSRPVEGMDTLVAAVDNYNRAYYTHGVGRSLFATNSGWIGLGPQWLKDGDHVCLLAGAQTAFILRPHGKKYQVVGDAYVHAAMAGEYWSILQNKGVELTEFVLV